MFRIRSWWQGVVFPEESLQWPFIAKRGDLRVLGPAHTVALCRLAEGALSRQQLAASVAAILQAKSHGQIGAGFEIPNIPSARQPCAVDNIHNYSLWPWNVLQPSGWKSVQDNHFLCEYLETGHKLSWESSGRNESRSAPSGGLDVAPIGSWDLSINLSRILWILWNLVAIKNQVYTLTIKLYWYKGSENSKFITS